PAVISPCVTPTPTTSGTSTPTCRTSPMAGSRAVLPEARCWQTAAWYSPPSPWRRAPTVCSSASGSRRPGLHAVPPATYPPLRSPQDAPETGHPFFYACLERTWRGAGGRATRRNARPRLATGEFDALDAPAGFQERPRVNTVHAADEPSSNPKESRCQSLMRGGRCTPASPAEGNPPDSVGRAVEGLVRHGAQRHFADDDAIAGAAGPLERPIQPGHVGAGIAEAFQRNAEAQPLPARQRRQLRADPDTGAAIAAAGHSQRRASRRYRIDAQRGYQHHVAIGLPVQVQRRSGGQGDACCTRAGPAQSTRILLRLVVERGNPQAAVPDSRGYGVDCRDLAIGRGQLQRETVRGFAMQEIHACPPAIQRHARLLRQYAKVAIIGVAQPVAISELRMVVRLTHVERCLHRCARPRIRQLAVEVMVDARVALAQQHVGDALALAAWQPRHHEGVGRIDLAIHPQRPAGEEQRHHRYALGVQTAQQVEVVIVARLVGEI